MAPTTPPQFEILDLEQIPSQPCPCGSTRRAFAESPGSPASFHVVQISADARPHYHRGMTEIYYVLEGEGAIELDGTSHPLRPGMAVLIKPGCRHRAIGRLKIANVAIPAFDPEDEWFD